MSTEADRRWAVSTQVTVDWSARRSVYISARTGVTRDCSNANDATETESTTR